MDNLDDYRNEIDSIDKEMTELFERRMDVVLKVAKYKKDNKLPILHNKREEQVLEKAVENLKNKEYSKEIKEFLNATMEISRGLQNRKIDGVTNISELNIETGDITFEGRLGFPGVSGSFSEEALLKFFGKNIKYQSFQLFEDVFKALENDEIDYGIVPIENSSTGAVSEVYDLIRKYGFYIVGEECIKVKQNLVGIKGTTLQDIKEVYSHQQGINQSIEFLREYPQWKLIPFNNTAASAKLVKDLKDKSKAAVASDRAAKIYDLDIIKEGINYQKDNYTRFVVISREMKVVNNADKVSVVFSLEHKVGTLFNLLRYFAENNLNMMKIESRPMKDTSWRYFLYVDFQGTIDSDAARKALSYIEKEAAYFRVLGSYKNKLD